MQKFIIGIMAILALSGCGHSGDDYRLTVEMPLSISIPMEATSRADADMGDPGYDALSPRPTHAYIFIASKDNLDQEYVYSEHVKLAESLWAFNPDLSDDLSLVYTYQTKININILSGATDATVYAALSTRELTLSATKLATESEVKAITFSIPEGISDAALDDMLQNLYCTPYKLREKVGFEEYAKIQELNSNVPNANIICYHNAAKLDLTWDVAEAQKENVKLSYIKVEDAIYSEGNSLFDPTNAASSLRGPRPLIFLNATSAAAGAGTQWYGRKSRYIIHNINRNLEASNTKLVIKLGKNWNDYENGNSTPYTLHQPIDPAVYDAVHTPWIRLNLLINNYLE